MRRIIGITTLLAVAVVTVAGLHGSAAIAPSEANARHAVTIERTGAADFAIGEQHAYEVSLTQTARSDSATRPELTVTVDGTWSVAYAGSDARGLVFRAELRDARAAVHRGDGNATAPVSARPYYFATTADGKLSSLYFPAEVDGVSRAALATLAASFQRSGQPEAIESDTIGDYRARYVRDGNHLHRDRVAYVRVAGDGVVAATIVATGTDIALRDDGWPDEISGAEDTRVGTAELGATVAARFSLRHRAVARIDAGWPDGLPAVAVDAGTADPAAAAKADRELVDGATLPDLLSELARIGGDTRARGHQFLRIAALLRLDPEAVRAARRSVLEHGADAPILIAALGEAGTPVAQAALADVLVAPALDAEPRTRAAIALGLTETPTPATLEALARAADTGHDDLASSALLAEGNAALRVRDDDPSAASQQVDALLARFANATSDQDRALVLRALGNTGDPRIVPALEQGLASLDPIVRAAATEALRLIPGADALILGSLRDPIAMVRAAAVFATGERALGPYAIAFDQLVRHDGEVSVRRAIVELAIARQRELPVLRALVEYAAGHDADAELRELAAAAL